MLRPPWFDPPWFDVQRVDVQWAIAGIVAGLISIGARLLIARASRAGPELARITGTVLFAIATLEALGGLANPVAALVKVVAFLVWLAGLAAVVLLWRATSTAHFKAARS